MRVFMFKLSIFVMMAMMSYGCHCDKSIDYTIHGIISDEITGALLPNVSVSVKDNVSDGDLVLTTESDTQITGSDGSYQIKITCKKGKKLFVIADKDKYNQVVTDFVTDAAANIQCDIKMSKSTIEYSGIVTDSDGNPVSDARVYVTIMQNERKELASVFTLQDGKYSLNAPNQNYESWNYYVTATKDGFGYQTKNMAHTPDDNGKRFKLDFQLQKIE